MHLVDYSFSINDIMYVKLLAECLVHKCLIHVHYPQYRPPSSLLILGFYVKYIYHLCRDLYVKELKMFNKSILRSNVMQKYVTPDICSLRSWLRPLQMKICQLSSFSTVRFPTCSYETVPCAWPPEVGSDGHRTWGQPRATRNLRVNACAWEILYLHFHVSHMEWHK